MGSLSFRAVQKTYGSGSRAVQVIAGLDMEVADGEFVAIVGPSGCGKSTLLRMVAGLEEITLGEIRIDGRIVNGLEPSERDIAMVFQNYALYPHMSVFDNMAYGLKIAGISRAEIEQRVGSAARILELSELLARKPRQLSGGQRQRVAMGRAIVRKPKVFLFDEPLSNLDARLRAQTRLEMRRLHLELGTTTLFVTHDQVEAMTLAQRMMVMNAGVVEQIGTPESVYARPASLFVASFIGSPPMNLLAGRAEPDGFILKGQPDIRLPCHPPHSEIGSSDLVLGVRPEHVRIAPRSVSDPLVPDQERERLGWPFQVDLTEMLGAERLIHGRLGAVPFTLRQETAQALPPASGRVLVQVAQHDLHWFDARTGRRVDAARPS
jgi:sn-glycerol 3-phosphate transport system ATP-binding protein